MELVAAAKMRRSQALALTGRPYTTTLARILGNISYRTEIHHRLFESNQSEKEMVILITSDRGLAGGLNVNIFREILRNATKNKVFVTVGRKALNFVAKTNGELIASYQSEEKAPLELARSLSKMTIDAYSGSQVSAVRLLYPHFESTIKQTPNWIQLLPIEIKPIEVLDEPMEEKVAFETTLFEPSLAAILDNILPHHILTQIYQVLLEAKASEHSARMVAMKNATDAASDLIEDLTLTYNQARQEAITKELLDIITAQKALE